MKTTKIVSLLSFVLTSLSLFATPAPIESRYYMDLQNYSGQSFLQTMIEPDYGVVAQFDADYEDTYAFANAKAVGKAIENFDRKNKNRILKMFNASVTELKVFTKALKEQEQNFSPSNINDKVGNVLRKLNIQADKYALAQFIAIASGAGTLIRINQDNYFYNFGYFSPEVRSGRSYGATNLHNANDASHLMYLRQLEGFLKDERNNHHLFYLGLLKFLVDTDVSVYEVPEFNDEAEAVLTDYITVYTAELRRHLMKNLHPSRAPWGNDMTEATFLSLFNVKSGLMMLQEGLVESSIKEHWALSRSGSGRSGFGINRKQRRSLQTKISNFFRKNDDSDKREVVLKIDRLIGKNKSGDVYRGVMEYLNNRKNLDDKSRVEGVESELPQAFVEFLMEVDKDTDLIVESLR